jgi:AcrR family transcriptional regulator
VRGGRRAGDSGTRQAILEAARALFAERGYHSATIRGIAAVAGVDPALVHHYFGTKEALFAAAMSLPVVPSEVLTKALAPVAGAAASGTAGRAEPGFGVHLVRAALTLWESAAVNETFLVLLRSAVTSEAAAVMLREFIADSILGTIGRVMGLDMRAGPQSQWRVEMVATQMLGLALTRMVLRLPSVAEASIDELALTIGPSIERYLTGDIAGPASADRRSRARPR